MNFWQVSLYRLQISGFQGDAQVPNDAKSFLNLNGSAFSTKDVDNDSYSSDNCAATNRWSSGWWFKSCFTYPINPNGINYDFAKTGRDTIHWYKWTNSYESLKSISMAIRKASIS